jgi:VIT1/CCC1 family predicted Fe2+/Mn2+ transporter
MSAVETRKGEPPFAKRYRDFWFHEQAAAWLYRQLADLANEQDAKTLRMLADVEDKHAGHWAALLERMGEGDGLTFTGPPRRERVLAFVARRWGVEKILPSLIRAEAADAGKYIDMAEAPGWMSDEELQHAQTLQTLGHNRPSQITRIESRHRVSKGGALRAATFGVNDGLVSNLSIIMGFAASRASADPSLVLLAGVAGLLAGAFSMAAGEWVSVRSQTELFEREIAIEEEELRLFPEEEKEELELIYRAKGVAPETAKALAEKIMQNKATALDTLAREELGLDPDELGSPWVAASASFLAFGVGAAIPLVPWMFLDGTAGIATSAGVSGVALALVGMMISVLTGKGALRSALRMLVIGGVAAAVTYAVGSLFDVPVT